MYGVGRHGIVLMAAEPLPLAGLPYAYSKLMTRHSGANYSALTANIAATGSTDTIQHKTKRKQGHAMAKTRAKK